MKRFLLLGICLLSAATLTPAMATDYSLPAANHGLRSFDFALQFSNTDLDLDYRDLSHDTELERVGISVFDTQDPMLEYGFIMGSSRVTISDDPNLAGISLNGYHLGLALHSHFGSNPQLTLRARYLYQEVSNRDDNQKSLLSWHEWEAGGQVSLRLVHALVMSAGVAQTGIDATQRLRGNTSLTQSIKTAGGSQYFAGLTLLVDNGGRVGLYLQRGIRRGFGLSFARSFY
jgi:hypothetical protein